MYFLRQLGQERQNVSTNTRFIRERAWTKCVPKTLKCAGGQPPRIYGAERNSCGPPCCQQKIQDIGVRSKFKTQSPNAFTASSVKCLFAILSWMRSFATSATSSSSWEVALMCVHLASSSAMDSRSNFASQGRSIIVNLSAIIFFTTRFEIYGQAFDTRQIIVPGHVVSGSDHIVTAMVIE